MIDTNGLTVVEVGGFTWNRIGNSVVFKCSNPRPVTTRELASPNFDEATVVGECVEDYDSSDKILPIYALFDWSGDNGDYFREFIKDNMTTDNYRIVSAMAGGRVTYGCFRYII